MLRKRKTAPGNILNNLEGANDNDGHGDSDVEDEDDDDDDEDDDTSNAQPQVEIREGLADAYVEQKLEEEVTVSAPSTIAVSTPTSTVTVVNTVTATPTAKRNARQPPKPQSQSQSQRRRSTRSRCQPNHFITEQSKAVNNSTTKMNASCQSLSSAAAAAAASYIRDQDRDAISVEDEEEAHIVDILHETVSVNKSNIVKNPQSSKSKKLKELKIKPVRVRTVSVTVTVTGKGIDKWKLSQQNELNAHMPVQEFVSMDRTSKSKSKKAKTTRTATATAKPNKIPSQQHQRRSTRHKCPTNLFIAEHSKSVNNSMDHTSTRTSTCESTLSSSLKDQDQDTVSINETNIDNNKPLQRIVDRTFKSKKPKVSKSSTVSITGTGKGIFKRKSRQHSELKIHVSTNKMNTNNTDSPTQTKRLSLNRTSKPKKVEASKPKTSQQQPQRRKSSRKKCLINSLITEQSNTVNDLTNKILSTEGEIADNYPKTSSGEEVTDYPLAEDQVQGQGQNDSKTAEKKKKVKGVLPPEYVAEPDKIKFAYVWDNETREIFQMITPETTNAELEKIFVRQKRIKAKQARTPDEHVDRLVVYLVRDNGTLLRQTKPTEMIPKWFKDKKRQKAKAAIRKEAFENMNVTLKSMNLGPIQKIVKIKQVERKKKGVTTIINKETITLPLYCDAWVEPDNAQLKKCYDCIKALLPTSDCECFHSVEIADSYYNFFKPDKVKVVLLAESHAFTSDYHANNGPIVDLDVLSKEEYGGPRGFNAIVYCLTYGEAKLDGNAPNDGTPQFWKFLACCAGYGVDSGGRVLKKDIKDRAARIRSKLGVLLRLKELGIWLLDTSIIGWYIHQSDRFNITELSHDLHKKQRLKPPSNMKRDTLITSWEMYTKHVVRKVFEAGDLKKLITIGSDVKNMLGRERLLAAVDGDESIIDEGIPAMNSWVKDGAVPISEHLKRVDQLLKCTVGSHLKL